MMEYDSDFSPPQKEHGAEQTELAFLRKQVMLLNVRLKEIEKYKSSFLSNTRNEIINPFSSILNLSGSLLRGGQTNAAQLKKTISLIYQETFALDFHLKTIFIAAEIESGECYPNLAFIKPEEIISQTLEALDHLFQKKDIRLVVCQSFEEDAWGDAEKLHMIFLGLLYHILLKSKCGDGISVKAYIKEHVLHAELYNVNVAAKEISLFDHAHFQDICMFNEDIQGIHLSVARSLTETLNGQMQAGTYAGEIAAFRLKIPVARQGGESDVFEQQGLIFK